MSTVACPSCQRKLALPEEGWNGWAQCPSCNTVFQQIHPKDRPTPTSVALRKETDYHICVGKSQPSTRDEGDFPFHKKLFRDGFLTGVAWLAIVGLMNLAAHERTSEIGNSVVGTVVVAPMAGLLVAVLFLYLFGNISARDQATVLKRIVRIKRITGLVLVLETLTASAFLFEGGSDSWFWTSVLVFVGLCCACLYEGVRVIPILLTVVTETDAEESRNADSTHSLAVPETGITIDSKNLPRARGVRR
jgi:hypothetical protein